MRDFMVVGAGMFGAAFARAATERGYSCLVIDRKLHVAGASHDVFRDNAYVSSYGAHIFHTNSDDVWRFVNRFADWEPFINKPKALAKGRVFSFPINLMTLHQLWGVKTPAEAEKALMAVRIPCQEPARNFEEWALSMVGREIYETFFYGYTKKQYHKEPCELPASIIKRLPIRLTYDENYFSTTYQAMPVRGYTDFVSSMLEGIEVKLGVNCPQDWRKYAKRLVYSGPVDALANYVHGRLDYNSLEFRTAEYTGDFQGNAVMNHCDPDVPHIRTVEYNHFRKDTRKHRVRVDEAKTWVTYDVPTLEGEPLYPILDAKNSALYSKYIADKPDNVILGGRLGEYSYYDMDQAIASALAKVRAL